MNALKRVEDKKVGVTGDDMRGVAAYGKLKKFVILRIAAGRDANIDIYPFSLVRKGCNKEPDILLIDIAAKLLSA